MILKLDSRIYPVNLITKAAEAFQELVDISLKIDGNVTYVSFSDYRADDEKLRNEFANYVLGLVASYRKWS